MSLDREKVNGKLVVNRIPKDLCYGKPADFVQALTQMLGVDVVAGRNNEFTVVGHLVPNPEDKDKLWIR